MPFGIVEELYSFKRGFIIKGKEFDPSLFCDAHGHKVFRGLLEGSKSIVLECFLLVLKFG